MKYLDKTGLTYLWGKIKGFVNSHEHPVGSIYITTSSTFNPATQWGGTWEKTAAGRCLIGASSAYPLGSTGGENTHFLAAAIGATDGNADTIGYVALEQNAYQRKQHYSYSVRGVSRKESGTFWNHCTPVTDVDKADLGVDNMQPYLAVNIWTRKA